MLLTHIVMLLKFFMFELLFIYFQFYLIQFANIEIFYGLYQMFL
jgi:hypothetical protein